MNPIPSGPSGESSAAYPSACPGCGPSSSPYTAVPPDTASSGAYESGRSPTPRYLPSLEEIASYHYTNPIRREQSVSNAAAIRATGTSPILMAPEPETNIPGESLQYLNGFMRSQIGRTVRVDFLIGTNTLVDKTGVLLGVGANYILLNESQTDDLLACDFYNIKFIHFYY